MFYNDSILVSALLLLGVVLELVVVVVVVVVMNHWFYAMHVSTCVAETEMYGIIIMYTTGSAM